MSTVDEIEKAVWKDMERAMAHKDTHALTVLSEIANDIASRKKEWEQRLETLTKQNGAATNCASTPSSPRGNGAPQNYSNRPIHGYLLNGTRTPVRSYRDLLVSLSNTLRAKHGRKFDETAQRFSGRKRLYFSNSKSDLFDHGRYAQVLAGGGLFVETNLNANLIVNNICIPMVAALEPGSDFSVE